MMVMMIYEIFVPLREDFLTLTFDLDFKMALRVIATVQRHV